MYSFRNDYSEGAHPRILEAMLSTNMIQSDGYSLDEYSLQATELIISRIHDNAPKNEHLNLDVHLLTGGTQTNLTSLSAFLRPHEAVIAAQTGHILVHETGAIEATGHKILSIASTDGKITPQSIQAMVDLHTDEHMVKPRLVFISDSTEIGSIYLKHELEAISACCRSNKLYLYLDGARLGSALCAESNDVTLYDIARLADAFYIGGTKNGALLGEALVISNDSLKGDFRYHMKQNGALLAKGRLIGIQFRELFRDNLYFELAAHANRMATVLRQALLSHGYHFLAESPTNQIFPILPDTLIEKLSKKYSFYIWEKCKINCSAIRLVTSWATDEIYIKEFIAELNAFEHMQVE